MNTTEVISSILRMQNRISELEAERQKVVGCEKLMNLMLTAEQVAQMHGVSAQTVRAYVRAGKIQLHPSSTEGKMWFRAGDVMRIDFKMLNLQKRRETMFARAL